VSITFVAFIAKPLLGSTCVDMIAPNDDDEDDAWDFKITI